LGDQEIPDSIIDNVYDLIDNLFLEGRFEIVNSLLEDIDVNKYPPDFLLSIHTISGHAKSKLSSWNDFDIRFNSVYKDE
jgi:hypothetical protein